MNQRPYGLCHAIWLLSLASICLAGCGPISSNGPTADGPALREDIRVKQAVLADLFDEQAAKSTVEATAFSLYMIDDPLGKTLAAAFKGHVPSVGTGVAIMHDESGKAIDKATGAPVKIFSVRIRRLAGDHASVGAGWSVATLDGEWFGYELDRINGVWVVKSRTVAGVS